MEELVGQTLRSRIAVGRVGAGELTDIVARVAAALHAAHEHGVLHGDVKPDNVFLGPGGAVLVDFGSSKVHGLTRLTATGDFAGTPAYMAPEVLRGARDLDGRLDVYALGLTAYEALAGRLPWEVRHPGALVAAIGRGGVPPLPPDVAPAVAAAVSLAMNPDPDARFLSASAFAKAFGNAAA